MSRGPGRSRSTTSPNCKPDAPCPVAYRWLNPLLTKQRQQAASVRQHTSDRTAVAAVAACLADGLGHPAHLLTDTAAQLREQRIYTPATPEEEACFRQHWRRFQQQLARQRQRQQAQQRLAA